MKKVIITIDTENAAFEPEPLVEIVRILRRLADQLDANESPESLRDINGNKVGTFFVDTWR